MANTVFNAHKPARELPISKTTSDLMVAVDKQLKHLTTDVRHTYGREFILLLLEMRRLIRKANAARTRRISRSTWNVSRVAITRWLGSWCTRIAITYAAAPGTQ